MDAALEHRAVHEALRTDHETPAPATLLAPGFEERLADALIDRMVRRDKAERDPEAREIVLAACAADPVTFVNDWCWTYDPRLPALRLPADIPFVLRPRQVAFLRWLQEREQTQTSGLVEKSRDEGASFLMCAYFLHHWLFVDGFAGAMGSRKQDLVDKIGDPKTLFWKVRYMLYSLPSWFLPEGFKESEHDNFLRLVNPASGATITGEAGDEMGRGGRASMYYVDEWAHVEHANKVNAAISQNSNVRIKVFTPHGVGNMAYQERFSGKFSVFTFHWRDNPDKNFTATRTVTDDDGNEKEETYFPWYEKQQIENDEVTLAQEVDIDYTASVEGIIIPAKWVQAAIDFPLEEGSICTAGLDVSGDGKDKTVYTCRRGGKVTRIKVIEGADVAVKASNTEDEARADEVDVLYYDKLGVGTGITATLKKKEEDLPFSVVGVSNGDPPTKRVFDDNPKVKAEERFAMMNAELWWSLRLRFWRTYQRATGQADHPDDDCISIPNHPTLIAQLSQPTYTKNSRDKIVVDKFGEGTKSPDFAESLMYAFAPSSLNRTHGISTTGKRELHDKLQGFH